MSKLVEGKVALVTGAAGGIGRDRNGRFANEWHLVQVSKATQVHKLEERYGVQLPRTPKPNQKRVRKKVVSNHLVRFFCFTVVCVGNGFARSCSL